MKLLFTLNSITQSFKNFKALKSALLAITLLLSVAPNANAQWTQLNSGITDSIPSLTFANFYYSGSDVYVSGTGYVAPNVIGGFFHSNNHGASWTKVSPFGRGVLITSGTRLLTGLNGAGGVMYSTDNGATWTSATGLPSAVNIVALASNAAGTKLFAANILGNVYQSSDNGTSWTVSGTGYNGDARAIARNGNVILAGGNMGIFKSTDDGATWTAAVSGITTSSKMTNYIVMTDSIAITVCGGQFWKSNDAGASWTTYSIPAGDVMSYGLFDLYAEANGHIVGKGFSCIVYSNDHGKTWSTIETGLPTHSGVHTASSIFFKNGVVWAGTSTVGTTPGNGIYRRVLNGTLSSNDIHKQSLQFKVFPNPSTGNFHLSIHSMKLSGNAVMEIYNYKGQMIHSSTINSLESELDVNDLSKGVYLMRISNGLEIHTTKVFVN